MNKQHTARRYLREASYVCWQIPYQNNIRTTSAPSALWMTLYASQPKATHEAMTKAITTAKPPAQPLNPYKSMYKPTEFKPSSPTGVWAL